MRQLSDEYPTGIDIGISAIIPDFQTCNQLISRLINLSPYKLFYQTYPSETKVFIFRKRHRLMKGPYMKFLHKFLSIAVAVGDRNVTEFLIDALGVNPFKASISGMTAFQVACRNGRTEVLQLLKELDFCYVESNKVFSKEYQMQKANESDYNTGLHYAALANRIEGFETVKAECAGNLGIFNGRNWIPAQCTREQILIQEDQIYVKEKLKSEFESEPKRLVSPNGKSPNALEMLDNDEYMYVIVCRDTEPNPENTLVFHQLCRINQFIKQTDDLESIGNTNKLANRSDSQKFSWKGSVTEEEKRQNMSKEQTGDEDVQVETMIIGGKTLEELEEEEYETEEKGGDQKTYGQPLKCEGPGQDDGTVRIMIIHL